jgi:NAD(P)-dependent dehydrogenase (short-subunit alcohol dehydrogenase family)
MTTTTTDDRTIVLITGANKGIGRAVADALSRDASYLVHIGARDPHAAETAAGELRTDGRDVRSVQIDVTDDPSIIGAAEHLRSAFGRLDVLINNAGIVGVNAAPSAVLAKDVRAVYDTNVFGPIAVTNAMLPLLRHARLPRIVNVSSGLGSLTLRSQPDFAYRSVNTLGYMSSKTALNAVTVGYAIEFERAGWKINAADPGYTATALNGFSGPRTVEQAATVIVHLATLGADGPTGGYFDENGPVPW